jgi:thiol-disulfide isomerase/thioredoxin
VGTVAAPEFPPDVEWLNTGRPLSLAELRGKVVLLDFWTYGCINCMHVIPDLKRLEEKYPDELVVIGVHSAKFTNEGDSDNIRQIIRRYELDHPIINDNEFAVWSTYGVNAWPTFVLIDPDGLVLGFHSGEGIYELFDFVIAGMIKEFGAKGRLDLTPLDIILEHEGLVDSPLLFPGKVLADEANGRLFIADSNHSRIVITDLEGLVLDVIGSGLAGWQDGGFATAAFFRPQGLTLADDNTLYVADTENHTLRRLDLASRLVTTVAGTGEQGRYQQFGGNGLDVALNSPWDVLAHEGLIYIAMAGQHQLWLYEPATEVVRAFAGSGREELKDGLLEEGGLNQPSGLATDGRRLYFADSEASAIRYLDLARGTLHTIVGTGLFDFGDVDGVGDMVRLQHPLGLVYRNGLLYVADTYNSKIKVVKPETRESSSFLGGSVAGWQDGHQALFDEPGGLSLAGDKVYIADTNNHAIRVADLTTREVSTLVLVDRQGLLTRQPEGSAYTGKIITLDPQTVAAGEGVIRLQLDLPDGYKLNELAPLSVEWSGQDGVEVAEARYQAIAPKMPVTVPAVFHEGETKLTADLVVYYCKAAAESLCLIERVRLLLPLVVTAGGDHTLTISHTIPQPPTVNH